jgi:hypothetical protein
MGALILFIDSEAILQSKVKQNKTKQSRTKQNNNNNNKKQRVGTIRVRQTI